MQNRMIPTTKNQLAQFPSIDAEFPGIIVNAAKDANAADVAKEEEAE